jgi:hypothetical protein
VHLSFGQLFAPYENRREKFLGAGQKMKNCLRPRDNLQVWEEWYAEFFS